MVDQLATETPKTKPFAGLANTFQVARKSVIVLHEPTDALLKSLCNLASFELRNASNLNAWDVLNSQKVLMTKTDFERLEQRINEADATSN